MLAGEGHGGHVARRHVLAAAQDLAGALARSDGADAAEVTRARQEVARLRG